MKRKVFNQYLSESNFRELFITEMGWNNPSGATLLPEYTIDERTEQREPSNSFEWPSRDGRRRSQRTFQIEQIAERSGFQILQCKVDEIPVSSVCKKLDTKLRKNAENYICIFFTPPLSGEDGRGPHHLWVAPVKKVEKRDLVLVEYDTVDKASFLFEKMEGLSFSLDDETPTILDIIEKVQAAFLINSEKITKDFYAGFKKEHTNFAKFITGIDDHLADKDNKNKQWYTSVMLNRLMFCYFIQKKGFLDGDVDYLRHKLEWTQENEGEDRFFNKFYKGFLVSLFHDGLNAPQHNREFEDIYGRIPYLNGGMFDVHQIEKDYAGLDIADEAFRSLFDFFDKWHWHLDDRMTATGRDINPDVLGYIFEQYINDRAQMGAYYTKEDITEYIGRNTIIPYLMDAVKQKDEKLFKTNGELWQFLRDSGDRYIFDAVKKGHDQPIPEEIAVGIDTTQPNLLERRSHWNERTPDALALPTEIWRETIERLQRYRSIMAKIENGEITAINDFITYNLDIRQFAYDYLSHTQNHLFVEYFYDALQRVTILDPTCGSGAFLFAALNILEPLYEVCISRMQEFHEKNQHLFNRQLQEIQNKYRSNIQYFIYKSIILRNLYGVDIMVEATEIAKLRLFLKMVAVVDVDKRDPNLGLDPLPDIDFNIRCGNTLVGYATQKELEAGIAYSDFFTAKEFRNKVTEEMEKVSLTYDVFKTVQLTQAEDMGAFKRAKHDLKIRLATLNDLLNRQMYGSVSSTVDYDAWLSSHQPFHWLAEFYEIINDHGGFDVIIGNPPYLELRDVRTYSLPPSYKTLSCGNLYAPIIERCEFLSLKHGKMGFIVPVSSVSTERYIALQEILHHHTHWYSNYDDRPSRLFEQLEHIRLSIHLLSAISNPYLSYSTGYRKWNEKERNFIFQTVNYVSASKGYINGSLPKLRSLLEISIIEKTRRNLALAQKLERHGSKIIYYSRKLGAFVQVLNFKPEVRCNDGTLRDPSEFKKLLFDNSVEADSALLALNSNLFLWFCTVYSDCRHVNKREVEAFPVPFDSLTINAGQQIARLSQRLMENLRVTSEFRTMKFAHDTLNIQCIIPKKSKLIIDEIDKLLASHYGFTEEELDFIINYDIKYRMGDELNEE